MTSQQGHSIRQTGVIRRSHAPLSGRYDFHGMKTKNGYIAEPAVPYVLSSIFPANGVGRVFYYSKPIAFAQGVNGRHIAGLAAQMHGNNYLWKTTHAFSAFEFLRKSDGAQVIRSWVNVDKIDSGSAVYAAIR
jgi:hypothetical protein